MLAAATKVKMRGSEEKNEQEHIRHFLHILVLVVQKKAKNVPKSVLHVQSCFFFLLIRPTSFLFGRFRYRRR